MIGALSILRRSEIKIRADLGFSDGGGCFWQKFSWKFKTNKFPPEISWWAKKKKRSSTFLQRFHAVLTSKQLQNVAPGVNNDPGSNTSCSRDAFWNLTGGLYPREPNFYNVNLTKFYVFKPDGGGCRPPAPPLNPPLLTTNKRNDQKTKTGQRIIKKCG